MTRQFSTPSAVSILILSQITTRQPRHLTALRGSCARSSVTSYRCALPRPCRLNSTRCLKLRHTWRSCLPGRSEERRVGKECRYRGAQEDEKRKTNEEISDAVLPDS